MYWFLQLSLIALNAAGLTLSFAFLRTPIALAPATEIESAALPDLDQAQSIEELYALRDELIVLANDAHAQGEDDSSSSGQVSHQLLMEQAIQTAQIKIRVEERAEKRLNQASRLARQAVEQGANLAPTLEELQAAEELWNDAIARLEAIPDEETFVSQQALSKLAEYRGYRDTIAYKVDEQQSGFLKTIAEELGRPDSIRIAVCEVAENPECRYWKGNEPPASPASLIKVPVAVALMQKVTAEKTDLESKIMVSPGNWTEDPDGSKIWTGQEHSLKELLYRMIDHSSNIATNQLIDYVGFDYINQVLQERGYTGTVVGSKLVGESTYPSNLGSFPNQMTAADLTHMMVEIYNQENPGDDVLLDALVSQYDWDFGYKALQKSPGNWAGEKTGQNSKVIGTTVGVNIGGVDGDRYIITFTIDYSANQNTLRQGIRQVVQHIADNGL